MNRHDTPVLRLPTRRAFFFLVAALAAAACTLTELADQTREYESSTVLVGRVEVGRERDGPIVVGAYVHQGDGWRLVHQTLLHEHGGYELIVPRGDYALFAFADRNGNGLFDAGEPAARHAEDHPVHASGSGMVAGLDMVLGDGMRDVPRIAPAPRHSTQAGALADIDAPAFSADSGRLGYWQPMSFFRSFGGNIYFLEPYDPAKTPVLFVHGALGSPQDWRYQIAQLDRSRFQAWLFHYPSGAAVESISNLLFWKLLNLQVRYHYERLVIVAHSMGGLVVRRFLLDSGQQLPQVQRFVSLSTPWAGEVSADTGVRLSPAVVPSWRDMQPDGAFMKSLFERRLPAGVEYDLLFGHRGAPGIWRPNNDGTVTLASQLRSAAQQEARLVFGYDEDHSSILTSPQVAAQLRTLLDAPAGAASRGSLDVRLSYGGDTPQGLPQLVLLPAEGRQAPITVALSAAAGGGRVGALPPGRYEVGVLADGYAAEPRRQTVTIDERGTATLSYHLNPQGTISGYVGEDRVRPAGSYHAPRAAARIRRFTLRGPAVERVLIPAAGSQADALVQLLDGRDQAWGSAFVFLGLPAGDYELSVESDDSETHRSRHLVVPGRAGALAPIVLQPRR